MQETNISSYLKALRVEKLEKNCIDLNQVR